MRNMSGIKPYQELAMTAKANGGPENYTENLYSAGVVTGSLATLGVISVGVVTYYGVKWLLDQLDDAGFLNRTL